MKIVQITEVRARALQAELQELEQKIAEAKNEHGRAAREEGGLFKNFASHTASQDIARWTADKARIEELLNRAEIVKINVESDEDTVEIGDVVKVKIAYEGEDPEELKFQIDGLRHISEVVNVTFESPMGNALRGKKVGEPFSLKRSLGRPTEADGTILGIVKAKDLETKIGETEFKKPYTLKMHS